MSSNFINFSDFPIGSIVTLKSHPYFSVEHKDLIFISGDGIAISPTMTIIETFKRYPKPKSNNYSLQCKCLWYSHISGKFEDIWLDSSLLKIISYDVKVQEIPAYGDTLIFNTALIEYSKKKISLKQIGNRLDDKGKSITGLLSFSSPALEFIHSEVYVSKDILVDKETGEIIRMCSISQFKCKYFNIVGNKFSEIFLPREVLILAPMLSAKYLDRLSLLIRKKTYLKVLSPNPTFLKTVFKPIQLIYKSGLYYLEGKDYLENKNHEILVTGDAEQFKEIGNPFVQLPTFFVQEHELQITSINSRTVKKLSVKKFWRIKYKDYNDKLTQRTIFDISFFFNYEGGMYDEIIKTQYIKAKCILSDFEERFFRVDRIQKIQVLNLPIKSNF